METETANDSGCRGRHNSAPSTNPNLQIKMKRIYLGVIVRNLGRHKLLVFSLTQVDEMFVKFLLCVLVTKLAKGCLYDTFHNTSVTLAGVRGAFDTIDGCFGPENNVDRVSRIQILNETVPILYEEAFHDLDYLLDIVLEGDGIREIRPGAFKNLPKLYLIRLKRNHIREIREGVFNNLSLSELSLVSNQIERIETSAFDHLPNLNIVLLNDNKLARWDPNWFRGSPKIAMLNFESNLIERLPTRAFRNVRGVHVVNNRNVSTTIHLNDNRIRTIDDGAFDGLVSLGWLFLQRNEINVFSQRSLGSLRQLGWLRLDHNRLQCIPERLIEVAPNVKYYLEGNPLTEECIAKFDIKTKSNGSRINKFNFTID